MFRSTPNKVGLHVRPPIGPFVHSFTKIFYDLNKIWYVGRGRWVIHDSMPYDPIQGQGHRCLKYVKVAAFRGCLLHLCAYNQEANGKYTLRQIYLNFNQTDFWYMYSF